MNDPENPGPFTTTTAAPIPDPFNRSADPPRPAYNSSKLGTAAVFFLFSALMRAAVDATYIIGAIQAGIGQHSNYVRLAVGIFHVVSAVASFGPLKRGSEAAQSTTLGLSALLLLHAGRELISIVLLRARGYTNTETQICLLSVLVFSLIVTLLYLALGKNAKAQSGSSKHS